MKRKKILLMLSLAMIGGVGVHAAFNSDVNRASAATTSVTLFDMSTDTVTASSTTVTTYNKLIDENKGDIDGNRVTVEYLKATNDNGMLKLDKFSSSRYLSFTLPSNYKLNKVTFYGSAGGGRYFAVSDTMINSPSSSTTDVAGNNAQNFAASTIKASTAESPITIFDSVDGVATTTNKFYINVSGTISYKNITIQVSLAAITHNVNYYSSDGLTQYTELTEEVEEGLSPTTSPVLDDVVGQKFVGWAAEVNGTTVVDPTTYTIGTEDLNFYAVWEAVTTHTVTITDYEGSEPRTLSFNDGDALVVDDPQEREGYEFLGWYTTSTFDEGTEVTNETVVTTDMNLYGKWGEATYVYVTFDVEGVTQEFRTIEGHTLSSWPEDPSIAGFSFYGWYDAEGVEYTRDSVFTSSITLYAKIDVIITSTYNFTDYTTKIGSVAADEVVLDDIVSIRDFNKQVDKAASVDGLSFTKGIQAKSVVVNLKYNAEVTVYAAQTGNGKTRKVAVIDNNGFMHYTDIDLGSGQTAMAYTLSLHAGINEICGFDYVTYDNASIKFNYYGVKIDYTNRDTVSVINDTKGYKLSNQAGYDASHNKAMRFVGEIDYTLVDEISSIYVSTSANKIIDNLPASEVLGSEYIYTVYDRVTLSEAPNAKYGVKDNRLYFYYIVDGVQDDYQTITCDAIITLKDGTMYKLTSTFDCVNAYTE